MMNSFCKLLMVFATLLFVHQSYGQIQISEISDNSYIEVVNSGTNTIDVSNYWLCNRPAYSRFNTLTVECGQLNLAPGASVTLSGFGLSNSGDELGIYINSNFGSVSAMADYVIYGNRGGSTREAVAVAAGLWSTGDRAPAINGGTSLNRDLTQSGVQAYSIGSSSICITPPPPPPPTCNVSGGNITLDNGATSTAICVDGVPDPLQVTFTQPATGSATGYIITDDAGNILALPPAQPFDLDGAGVGNCFIYSVSYESGFGGAVVGNNISNLTGCFDLSNSILVYRQAPDGGSLSLLDGSTSFAQCAGQIVFDVTHTTNAPNLSYWYIITDDNNIILDWVNSANSNTIDLSAAPAGVCRVWGWSYRGLPNPVIGDPLSTLRDDTCEDVSDSFITVYREIPDGGSVSLLNGSTSYTGTAGNIVFDVTHTTTAPNLSYWYIITDEVGTILGWVNSANSNTIDLSSAPPGVCRIWGWNYRGLSDPVIGQPLSTLRDDFCEDVSDNFITVTRQGNGACNAQAETLSLSDGRTSLQVCAADGEPDYISFGPFNNTVGAYQIVVTNANDYIISLPTNTTINVDGMSIGEYRIYLVAYMGTLNGLSVGNNINNLQGCFDLSNAFLLDRIQCDPNCQMPINLRYKRLGSNAFLISWDRSPDANKYEIELGFEGSSSRFKVPISGTRVFLITGSTRVILVRVRSICNNGFSPYSNYISFQAEHTRSRSFDTGDGEVFGEFIISQPELEVFPNPASEYINVDFKLDIESTLQIYDATGKEMYRSDMSNGPIDQRIDISQMPQGIYHMVISSDGEILDQSKFIKIN